MRTATVPEGTRAAKAGATKQAPARLEVSRPRYLRLSRKLTCSGPASDRARTSLMRLSPSASGESSASASLAMSASRKGPARTKNPG